MLLYLHIDAMFALNCVSNGHKEALEWTIARKMSKELNHERIKIT